MRPFVRIVFAFAVVAAASGWMSVAERDRHFPIGRTVAGSVKVGFVTVPLPPGDWIVVGRAAPDSTLGTGMIRIYLANVQGTHLKGLILINASAADTKATRWRESKTCTRKDLFYVTADRKSGGFADFNCMWLNHERATATRAYAARPDYIEMNAYLRERKIAVPTNFAIVGYEYGDMNKWLQVRYRFNPDLDGIAPTKNAEWSVSDWHRDRIHHHPDKLRYMERLKKWAEDWRPKVGAGFAAR